MKRLVVVAVLLCFGLRGNAQSPDASYTYKHAWSVFADYSNTSSHIFLGTTQNRKIAGLGASYAHRILASRNVQWTYEAELRPLYFIRDPVSSGTTTLDYQNGPSSVFSGTSEMFSGPVQADCTSGTYVTTGVTNPFTVNGVLHPGTPFTRTVVQVCGTRWTYAGGVSPLGQRVNFRTRSRLQPFFAANAGFLVSPRDVPANYSSNFNFTFEGGVGVEWFRDHRHSWAVDYRVHHLSNNYNGYINPGIDSSIFRVAYKFGR